MASDGSGLSDDADVEDMGLVLECVCGFRRLGKLKDRLAEAKGIELYNRMDPGDMVQVPAACCTSDGDLVVVVVVDDGDIVEKLVTKRHTGSVVTGGKRDRPLALRIPARVKESIV